MASPHPPGGAPGMPRRATAASGRHPRRPRGRGRLLVASLVLVLLAAVVPRTLADEELGPWSGPLDEQSLGEDAPVVRAPAGEHGGDTGGGHESSEVAEGELARAQVTPTEGRQEPGAAVQGSQESATRLAQTGGPGDPVGAGCEAGGSGCSPPPVLSGGSTDSPSSGSGGYRTPDRDPETRVQNAERQAENLGGYTRELLEIFADQLETLHAEVPEPDQKGRVSELRLKVHDALERLRGGGGQGTSEMRALAQSGLVRQPAPEAAPGTGPGSALPPSPGGTLDGRRTLVVELPAF